MHWSHWRDGIGDGKVPVSSGVPPESLQSPLHVDMCPSKAISKVLLLGASVNSGFRMVVEGVLAVCWGLVTARHKSGSIKGISSSGCVVSNTGAVLSCPWQVEGYCVMLTGALGRAVVVRGRVGVCRHSWRPVLSTRMVGMAGWIISRHSCWQGCSGFGKHVALCCLGAARPTAGSSSW